jgi:hypothetical protein
MEVIQQHFAMEFENIINGLKEYHLNFQLPILYLLFSACIFQIGNPLHIDLKNFYDFEDFLKYELLNVPGSNQKYGYRISFFLGCNLVKDFEAEVSRRIIHFP